MSDNSSRAQKKPQRQKSKPPKKTARSVKKAKSDTYEAIAKALDAATPEQLSALQSNLIKGENRVAGIPLSRFDAGYLAAQLVAYHKKPKPRHRPKIYMELFFPDDE
jgi:hypothetical protein